MGCDCHREPREPMTLADAARILEREETRPMPWHELRNAAAQRYYATDLGRSDQPPDVARDWAADPDEVDDGDDGVPL
jgi:hypothetical protein